MLICRVFPPKGRQWFGPTLDKNILNRGKDVLTFPAVRCGHLRHLRLIFHDISDLWKPTVAVIVWEYRTHNKYKDVQRCTVQRCTKYTQFQSISHIMLNLSLGLGTLCTQSTSVFLVTSGDPQGPPMRRSLGRRNYRGLPGRRAHRSFKECEMMWDPCEYYIHGIT